MAEIHINVRVEVDVEGVVATMRRLGVALADIDLHPFLSFVTKDNTSPDWYDLWTRDLL